MKHLISFILFYFIFICLSATPVSDKDKRKIDSLKTDITLIGKSDTSIILDYFKIGEIYYKYSLDSMVFYSQKAVEFSDKALQKETNNEMIIAIRAAKASALNNMGFAQYKLGKTDEALSNFKKSLQIKELINDEKGVSKSLNNIATIYNNQGKILEALEYYFKSLKIKEKLGDKKGVAITLNNIGSIYSDQKNLQEAKSYFERSNKIYVEIGDSAKIATTINSTAGIYADFSRSFRKANNKDSADYYLKLALDSYKEALNIRIKINDIYGQAFSYNNIGKLYNETANNTQSESQKISYQKIALENYRKSLNLFKSTKYTFGISVANFNMGKLFFEKNLLNQAEKHALISYKTGKELGYPFEISNAAKLLSEILEKKALSYNLTLHKKSKYFKDALKYYKEYSYLNDSINNEKNKKGTLRQQFIYTYKMKVAQDSIKQLKEIAAKDIEIQKGEEQIALKETQKKYLIAGIILVTLLGLFAWHKSNIANRQKKIIEFQKLKAEENEKKMAAALRDNKALLTEIHHRVKNNLQIITSLIYLQITKSNNKQVNELLGKTRERIKSIALIHEKLYKSESFGSVDFASYMERLAEDYEIIYNLKDRNIKLLLKLDGLFLDLKNTTPAGLLMNELITNSIKYAFDEKGGKIEIIGSEKDGNVKIEVKDNGIGFPENFKENLSESIGLRLSEGLVKQIGGNMEINNSNGASVIITFPKRTS